MDIKRPLLAAACLLLAVPLFAADAAPSLDTESRKLSYAIGVLFGRNMALEVDVDVDAFLQGIRDVMEQHELRLSPEELKQVVTRFQTEQQAARSEAAARNLAEGRRFLEENLKKEGVVELPSGVQYKVLEKGEGKRPGPGDTVTVHYRGTLLDGTEFDSSWARGEPATIPLGNVIPGWKEAVTAMPVGSKWMVYIPPASGYGEQGAGTDIGPNATLVFEIELLAIQ